MLLLTVKSHHAENAMPNLATKLKATKRKTALTNKAVTTSWVAVASVIGLLCSAPAVAVELPTLSQQDTIVVTADQAWESDDGNVLNFEGNFELTAPDYSMRSQTAEIHGAVDSPSRIVAIGSPVTFWIRDLDSDVRTHGQGERVEFDRENHLLRVAGKAVLQREKTVMRSSNLEYDTENKRLIGTGKDGVEIVTQPIRD